MKHFVKIISAVLSVSMLSILLAACGSSGGGAATEATTTTEEPTTVAMDYLTDIDYYGDGQESHLCDIFGVDGTVKPVVVEIHGGAYTGGSKETNTDHSIYWAENGFIVVDINYTLLPTGTFETSMDEFFQVLHFIEENAETYGFDTNNVFLSGDSAGGSHVQMIAATWVSPELQEHYQVTKANISINGLVITCIGIADMKDGATVNGEDLISPEMGKYYDLKTYMNAAEYPPVCLIGSPKDKVACDSILEFDEYLTEIGVEHELIYIDDEENSLMHVYNILHTDWKESIEANSAAVDFMKAHLK